MLTIRASQFFLHNHLYNLGLELDGSDTDSQRIDETLFEKPLIPTLELGKQNKSSFIMRVADVASVSPLAPIAVTLEVPYKGMISDFQFFT